MSGLTNTFEEYSIKTLKSDPLYKYITPEKVRYYLDGGIRVGESEAQKYIGCNIDLEIEKLGFEIRRSNCPESLRALEISARTILTKEKSLVEIYTDIIAKKAENARKCNIEISYDEMETLHLAHELFHCIEYSTGEFAWAKFTPVSLKILGFIPLKRSIKSISEVAAHSFAYAVTGKRIIPQFTDELYHWGRS